MSRPFEGTQQPTAEGWHEVEPGVHVTSLDHLTEECRSSGEALLKLLRGGGVVVERKAQIQPTRMGSEHRTVDLPLENLTREEALEALLRVVREGRRDPGEFWREALEAALRDKAS